MSLSKTIKMFHTSKSKTNPYPLIVSVIYVHYLSSCHSAISYDVTIVLFPYNCFLQTFGMDPGVSDGFSGITVSKWIIMNANEGKP